MVKMLSNSENATIEIQDLAKKSRLLVLEMTNKSKASHVGSCLSVIDVLSTIYFLQANSKNFDEIEVILSKGHAAAAAYSILANLNEISMQDINKYCEDGSLLNGHISHLISPRIRLSTGSLGHGFPFGIGLAIANLQKQKEIKTFVVMSDGECDEGTTWESALIANQFKLKNLVVVIDRNFIQSLGRTEDVMKLEPLAKKWESFGFQVIEIDGHDYSLLFETLNRNFEVPTCIIANTTKGKGVSYMEDTVLWHYRSPNLEELTQAKSEVEGTEK
jgi:transketolase